MIKKDLSKADKEKAYLDYLKTKSKYIVQQIDKLKEDLAINESRLIENDICPWCFNKLKDDKPYFQYATKSCSCCSFEWQEED